MRKFFVFLINHKHGIIKEITFNGCDTSKNIFITFYGISLINMAIYIFVLTIIIKNQKLLKKFGNMIKINFTFKSKI